MQSQKSEPACKKDKVYVGIDVHLKSWTVTILNDNISHRTYTQPASAAVLVDYLRRNFPESEYYSAYEAGFCGFNAHYQLLNLGVNSIVVNAADIPTTQKELFQKNDPVDSRKIARALRANQLSAIHVLELQTLEDRSLVRTRDMIVRDIAKLKCRIKSFLRFYGIDLPAQFNSPYTHWSNRFMEWLKEGVKLHSPYAEDSLNFLTEEVKSLRHILLEVNKKIRTLCSESRYSRQMDLLMSIPGIGRVSAITLLTQLEQIRRFRNTDTLASYVGLVPNTYSSGEKESIGEITFRGQKILKRILVECAWMTIRCDPALSASFNAYCRRMQPNKAIVRIARKLLNRIYYVLKNEKVYTCGIKK
ncbi:IS110 family transposase [uncultured Sphingobacterium sp.]|uniref:IS110 family transposase n=1 Tax=uncultured Sphingobacterium sp. TaxID=182688 RepID=UPI00259719B8|nr:IS110 family transposase [uncultured Sphingobacterium sp.]